MTEEDIHYTCKEYKIENYTINDDMTVDVNGDVELSNQYLSELPLKFNKVLGDFYCSRNNLTTLEGCPNYVGRDFSCSNNMLENLKDGPEHVNGVFWCMKNVLTSLEGSPKYVKYDFNCSKNHIMSLDGLPVDFYIGDDFRCTSNEFRSTRDYGKLFFGTVVGNIITFNDNLNEFLNKHKNPPKKDLPRLLSELRKIKL